MKRGNAQRERVDIGRQGVDRCRRARALFVARSIAILNRRSRNRRKIVTIGGIGEDIRRIGVARGWKGVNRRTVSGCRRVRSSYRREWLQ